jgi:ribosome biogenesis GTPase A
MALPPMSQKRGKTVKTSGKDEWERRRKANRFRSFYALSILLYIFIVPKTFPRPHLVISMGLFKRLFAIFRKKKVQILTCGLDGVGKSTMINFLKPKKVKSCPV